MLEDTPAVTLPVTEKDTIFIQEQGVALQSQTSLRLGNIAQKRATVVRQPSTISLPPKAPDAHTPLCSHSSLKSQDRSLPSIMVLSSLFLSFRQTFWTEVGNGFRKQNCWTWWQRHRESLDVQSNLYVYFQIAGRSSLDLKGLNVRLVDLYLILSMMAINLACVV